MEQTAPELTYTVIGTGSSGNAVVINRSILIDCGLPYIRIKPYAKELKLILLSHGHQDHFKPATVAALHRERPSVRWGCCVWMVEPLLTAGVSKRVIDVYEPGKTYSYGAFSVRPERLFHNVPQCGYHIDIGGKKLFYATDTGTLEPVTAQGYDLYLIEANYSKAELEERIAEKRSAEQYAYELDVMHNHLSQEQAYDFLARNAGPNSKYVFLHQHRQKE